MKKKGFTLEEYLPGGRFLFKSFSRDRKLLELRFRQFTPAYLAEFEKRLDRIDKLESTLVKSKETEQVTVRLYESTNFITKELEFLAFYLKRAKLDLTILSGVRKDVRNGNVEGAGKKLEDVVQYVKQNAVALEAQGLPTDYDVELTKQKDTMGGLNDLQNEYINARILLTSANKGEYVALYTFISEVAEAGKIYFDGKKEEDEYTITKLISRMRSGNSGGADEKDSKE